MIEMDGDWESNYLSNIAKFPFEIRNCKKDLQHITVLMIWWVNFLENFPSLDSCVSKLLDIFERLWITYVQPCDSLNCTPCPKAATTNYFPNQRRASSQPQDFKLKVRAQNIPDAPSLTTSTLSPKWVTWASRISPAILSVLPMLIKLCSSCPSTRGLCCKICTSYHSTNPRRSALFGNQMLMFEGISVNEEVIIRLKWGQTEYKGRLVSIDSYMNIQLSGAEEWIDQQMTSVLGQVLIRYVGWFYYLER